MLRLGKDEDVERRERNVEREEVKRAHLCWIM